MGRTSDKLKGALTSSRDFFKESTSSMRDDLKKAGFHLHNYESLETRSGDISELMKFMEEESKTIYERVSLLNKMILQVCDPWLRSGTNQGAQMMRDGWTDVMTAWNGYRLANIHSKVTEGDSFIPDGHKMDEIAEMVAYDDVVSSADIILFMAWQDQDVSQNLQIILQTMKSYPNFEGEDSPEIAAVKKEALESPEQV